MYHRLADESVQGLSVRTVTETELVLSHLLGALRLSLTWVTCVSWSFILSAPSLLRTSFLKPWETSFPRKRSWASFWLKGIFQRRAPNTGLTSTPVHTKLSPISALLRACPLHQRGKCLPCFCPFSPFSPHTCHSSHLDKLHSPAVHPLPSSQALRLCFLREELLA